MKVLTDHELDAWIARLENALDDEESPVTLNKYGIHDILSLLKDLKVHRDVVDYCLYYGCGCCGSGNMVESCLEDERKRVFPNG